MADSPDWQAVNTLSAPSSASDTAEVSVLTMASSK